jgi:hypothetical protein
MIITQKLETNHILKSNAIMLDSESIGYLSQICNNKKVSYLVWDKKLISSYKHSIVEGRQELISRLNSVDVVIMDSKVNAKIS